MDFLARVFAEVFKNTRRSKKWRILSTTLAGIVVFVTTYTLILPAITIERSVAEQTPGIFMDEIILDDGVSDGSMSYMQAGAVSEGNSAYTGFELSDGSESLSTGELLTSEMSVAASGDVLEEMPLQPDQNGTAGLDLIGSEPQVGLQKDFYAGFDRMLVHLVCDEYAGIPETAFFI